MSRKNVRFLTREGCPLCDEARVLVYRAVKRAGRTVEEIDVDKAAGDWQRRFGDRVPVVLAPDGSVLAEGHIDRRALIEALRKWASKD